MGYGRGSGIDSWSCYKSKDIAQSLGGREKIEILLRDLDLDKISYELRDKANKELMDGKVIYLTAPIEFISERINNSDVDRPLMSKYTVKELLMKREELYHYFMDVEVMNIELDNTIDVIKGIVGE